MDRNQVLNDPETAMRYALDGRQAQIWTALPAIVKSVNLLKMTLEAQPAIKGVQTGPTGAETFVDLPLLLDVPICVPSAGGFSLTLPIAVGDEILIIIASRCIDSWWQNGGVGVPIESRMHDLSDGYALPGPRSIPRLVPNISAVNAQLRNDTGTVYLEITPTGRINMVAPLGVHVTGNLVVSGEVTAGIIPVNLTTHVHPGVTSGGSSTGAPI